MSYASAPDTRNYGINTQAPVIRTRQKDRLKTIVQQYIATHFRPLRNGAYHLAEAARLESVRTAEGWISGRSWPRDDDLAELCAACRGLQIEIQNLAREIAKERGLED